ncbi:MAG: hypothetical protein IKL58_00125 [Phascolarctobacterium sp.]|nr:hypothetical protein [Phascolarctobacterium sp.]
MISLSAIGKQEKNKLSTDSAFIVLVEIQLKDDVIRLCYNTEDVFWNNQLWQAFPMQLGEVGEDGAGSDPNVELKVDNVSQALQYHVEEAGGGVGLEVVIRVVNTKALDYEEPETEEHYVVQRCTVDQQFVSFTLGCEYSGRTRRPLDRYMKNNCRFKYKGIRCAATSSLPTCDHTLRACRERNNSKRFGGFPGIDQKGVYAR